MIHIVVWKVNRDKAIGRCTVCQFGESREKERIGKFPYAKRKDIHIHFQLQQLAVVLCVIYTFTENLLILFLHVKCVTYLLRNEAEILSLSSPVSIFVC